MSETKNRTALGKVIRGSAEEELTALMGGIGIRPPTSSNKEPESGITALGKAKRGSEIFLKSRGIDPNKKSENLGTVIETDDDIDVFTEASNAPKSSKNDV